MAGMSLAEVMVGVGLLGGVSVVTMTVMKNQASNDSYLKYTAAVNKAAMQVQNSINNSSRCNEMLAGQVRDPNSWPNVSTAPLSSLRIKKDATSWEVLLQENQEYAEGFFIPTGGIRLMTSSNGASISELVITFKTRNRAQWKNNARIQDMNASDQGTIIKRIPFVSMIEGGTNKLRSCGPVVADEDIRAKERMCIALGTAATWNAGTATCTINSVNCPAGEVPIQMTSLGNLSCAPVSNAQMRDQLFDFRSTTCPAGQGVTLTMSPEGKIMAGCTGTANGCPAMNMVWYSVAVTGSTNRSQCSAAIGAGSVGSTTNLTDSTAPTTGSASYICDGTSRTWKSNGASTCADSSAANCASQVVRWSGSTKFCYATAPAMNEMQSGSVSDSTNEGGTDGMGSAQVECSGGKVSVTGTVSCN